MNMALAERSSAIRRARSIVARLVSKTERDCILDRIPKNAVCAEIGVYKGDFSARILQRHPKKLHLVDPWKFEPGPAYVESWYGGSVGESQARMDAIHQSVVDRFAGQIRSGVVEMHHEDSATAGSTFLDSYFDWIYIDGNHQYEYVMSDLKAYLPKVKASGLIAGDDYGIPGWWQDGVTRAVDELVRSGCVEKLSVKDHQFLLRKR